MSSKDYINLQTPPIDADWLNDVDKFIYELVGEPSTLKPPTTKADVRGNLSVPVVATRKLVTSANQVSLTAFLNQTEDLLLRGVEPILSFTSKAGTVYRVTVDSKFTIAFSNLINTNTGKDLIVERGDTFAIRFITDTECEILNYCRPYLQNKKHYPFALTYAIPPNTPNLTVILPSIVVQFGNRQVTTFVQTYVVQPLQITDVWLRPDNTYLFESQTLIGYLELPRYEEFLHICRIQSSATKIQGIYTRRTTRKIVKQPVARAFNYYHFKDQFIIPSVYTPWVNNVAVEKGVVRRSEFGDLWQCEKSGVCAATPDFPKYSEENNTGFSTEASGTATFSFRGRSAYKGAWRLSARAGISWYFSHIAAGILARKFKSEVKAYLTAACFHLVNNWVSGAAYQEGRKVAGPLTRGWAWECLTPGTATATIPFPVDKISVSIGTKVTDGDITWRAIGPYTHDNQKWFWYDSEPTMRGGKSPDSHDSYASTFVWACWKYLKASNDAAWLSSASPHDGYTFSQLIKEVIYSNLSTQLNPNADNLTKTFQGDGVPFGGTYAASFLMDNCESWAGFYAAQKIYTDFLPEPAYAEQMRIYTVAVAAGINNLWQESAGAFKYVFGLPTMEQTKASVFYPLCMSQAWAFLWGVPIDMDRNYKALDYMQTNYPHWWERNDVDDLLALGAHHGLLSATGNQKIKKDILDRIEIERFVPGQADTYVMDAAYYFDIRDSTSVTSLTD